MIVIVYVPLFTPLEDTFIVEEPEPPGTDDGLNVGVGPAQLAVSATMLVNPPLGVTVIVKLAVLPARTEALVGEAEMLKSAAEAVTFCVMGDEVLAAKLESPPYRAVIVSLPTASEEVDNFAAPRSGYQSRWTCHC